MIFVTVGAQMPFDRLVRTIDVWAEACSRSDVFAQIGPSEYRPRRIEWTRFLEPLAFRERVQGADLLVAHAGMGSIITAMEIGKPILIMPRRGDLCETRNDHQIATAERLRGRAGIEVAMDEVELERILEGLVAKTPNDARGVADRLSPHASPELIHALRQFIFHNEAP